MCDLSELSRNELIEAIMETGGLESPNMASQVGPRATSGGRTGQRDRQALHHALPRGRSVTGSAWKSSSVSGQMASSAAAISS